MKLFKILFSLSCCLTKKGNYLSSASLSWESLPSKDITKSFSVSILFAFFFLASASLGFLPPPFPMLGPSTASSQLKESLLGAGHLFAFFSAWVVRELVRNCCHSHHLNVVSLFWIFFFLYLLVYFIYHT